MPNATSPLNALSIMLSCKAPQGLLAREDRAQLNIFEHLTLRKKYAVNLVRNI